MNAPSRDTSAQIERMRRSAALLLAAAVQQIYPDAKLAAVAAIDNGFFADVELPYSLRPEDLSRIENTMRATRQRDEPITREVVSRDAARKRVGNNPYAIALVDELAPGESVTIHRLGNVVDVGPRSPVDSAGKIGPFRLLDVSGAYWQGDDRRQMLQRIHGTAWPTQAELDRYLERLEEARKRDHRRLGRELELFFTHPTAPGMPYWLPKGVALLDQLQVFWRSEHQAAGYQEVATPILNKKEPFERSGHWDHYRDDMFRLDLDDGEIYALKPMNCPNAMVTFGFTRRSYRDLPLRLADLSPLHRYELSGTFNGLFRAREFRQDDAHIFVAPDQVDGEFRRVLALVDRVYSLFGLDYRFRLGTRPCDFMGDDATWDRAEAILEQVLRDSGRDYWIEDGDGAFYGPKIDILMRDSLGREWQMGTIQLDFQTPRRFELVYAAEDGSLQTPIVIHRAIFGSVERFVGILIEHLNGAFPAWLAPVQAAVIPIADAQHDYARKVADKLRQAGLRVEVNTSGERMQAKIRDAQVQKVPWMLVVGRREEAAGTVSIRLRSGENLGAMPVSAFLDTASRVIRDMDSATPG
jgi:threonyl-tRNA synthetase